MQINAVSTSLTYTADLALFSIAFPFVKIRINIELLLSYANKYYYNNPSSAKE